MSGNEARFVLKVEAVVISWWCIENRQWGR